MRIVYMFICFIFFRIVSVRYSNEGWWRLAVVLILMHKNQYNIWSGSHEVFFLSFVVVVKRLSRSTNKLDDPNEEMKKKKNNFTSEITIYIISITITYMIDLISHVVATIQSWKIASLVLLLFFTSFLGLVRSFHNFLLFLLFVIWILKSGYF